MLKRELRTRFDLLRPSVEDTVYEKQCAQIANSKGNRGTILEEGDVVMTDDHGVDNKKRIQGKIIKKLSPSTFMIRTASDKVWKRHTDQIIKLDQNALRRSERLKEKARATNS